MSGAIVGALRVVLGADTAALDKGLKDSQSSLTAFGNAVQIGMAAVATAVAGAAAAIAVGVKSAINSADQLNKLSQSTGVSVEELSKLKYAAELSDVSMESLAKSLGKLSKAMVSAGTDSASTAGRAFTAMGISVKNATDGSLRPTSEVLLDLADKFSGYKDGAEKTSLAIALFGKAGASLIPLLNEGKDGLKEAGDEAQKFGLVLDKQTTLAAEAFNDNLKKLDLAKQGLYITISARLLPALESLSAEFLETKKNSTFAETAADLVTTAVRVLSSEVAILIEQLRGAAKELAAFKDFVAATGDINDLKEAWNRWGLVVSDNEDRLATLKSSLGTLSQNLDSGSFVSRFSTMTAAIAGTVKETKRLQEEAKKTTAPGVGDTTEQKNALQTFLDGQQKRIASINAEAETVGKSSAEQAKLKLEYEAQAVAMAKGIALTPALTAQITATGDAAAAAAMKLQGANLTQEMLAPWDLRNQKLMQYNALLQAGAISTDTFAAASLKVQFPAFAAAAQSATDFGQRLGDLAVGAINGLSNALASVIMGTKSAAEAFKAFALQVITDLIAMIVKAVIFKAIMIAIGFADGGPVSMSQSTGSTGLGASGTGSLYASGGWVSGAGSGTSDSIPAMLSNGEFVVNAQATKQWAPLLSAINSGNLPAFKDGGDVSQSTASMASAGGGSRTIVMQGFMWSRDQIRDMFAALNEGMRDGHKLDVQFA